MSSAIKKASIEELVNTMDTVLDRIEVLIGLKIKELTTMNKKHKIWCSHTSFKAFLKDIERTALLEAAEKLDIGDSTIRDRWKTLTLPTPVFDAIVSGEVSFSKCKPMTSINFNPESESDNLVAEEILEVIKQGKTLKEIKEYVAENKGKVWNESNVVIKMVASEYGVTEDSIY